MRALTAGPYRGWHFHRATQEFVLYRHGRPALRVAREAWEDFRRHHEGLIPL